VSHHLDTPLASQNGQLYIDDLYVFEGNDATVIIMDVNSNITGVYAQPGFHPEARYEIKVHFDGADFEDLTYRASFGEADASGRQALQLHALSGADAREDSAAGALLLEGRTDEAASGGGTRIWAGRIADSFYIDLSLLAIVNGAVAKGTAADLSAWRRTRPRTASPARASTRSCWRSPIRIRGCGPGRGSGSGAPPNSPRTRAAGGRSTGPGTR
jgi:hypothetical protein